jgi:uncharacterized protein (DUF488 family)
MFSFKIPEMEEKADLFTLGHSTRTFDEFLEILKTYGIEHLVDVRTVPRSRRHPHFSQESLVVSLPEAGIQYTHMKELGGFRKPLPDSPNRAWRNESFRGYADYMQTEAFQAALARLIEISAKQSTVILCAEAVPWRCHRSLIADAMLVHGKRAADIFDAKTSKPHKLTPFARVEGERLTYPAEETGQSEA